MRFSKNTKLQIFAILLILSSVFFACNPDDEYIPYEYVNIELYLTYPQYSTLNAIGNHLNIPGGVKGIIVYRSSFDEFKAYDRCCPHDPECGRVTMNSDGTTATDTCCRSVFSIINEGIPKSGPSKRSLKQYQTFYNPNTDVLLITN